MMVRIRSRWYSYLLVLAEREKQSVPRPKRAKKFSATRNEKAAMTTANFGKTYMPQADIYKHVSFYSWIHSASLGSASLYQAPTGFVGYEHGYRRVSLRHNSSRTIKPICSTVISDPLVSTYWRIPQLMSLLYVL